jgi:hypothetical protein
MAGTPLLGHSLTKLVRRKNGSGAFQVSLLHLIAFKPMWFRLPGDREGVHAFHTLALLPDEYSQDDA